MPTPTSKRTTAPAYQHYARDFLSDDKVCRMSFTEIGVYQVLLDHSWLGRGLPNDTAQIAKMLKLPHARFLKIWLGVLHECFVEKSGRLVNPRLERERKKQDDYRRSQSDKATARWQSTGNAAAIPERQSRGNALQSSSASASASSSTAEKKEHKAAAPPPAKAKEPNDNGNYFVIEKIALELLGLQLFEGESGDSDFSDAVKSLCAKRRIAYGPPEVAADTVARACASARVKLVKAKVSA